MVELQSYVPEIVAFILPLIIMAKNIELVEINHLE